MGDNQRYIRGGVVDPRPRSLHSFTVPPPSPSPRYAFRNETLAIEHIPEIRDDFALRGRCGPIGGPEINGG